MKISRRDKQVFGALVNKYRLKLPNDMKPIRKLAAACDMNFSTLNDIEHGDGFPTKSVALKLSQNLQLDEKKKHSFLDKYANIAVAAPPDVDLFLTSDDGKKIVPILREIENKVITDQVLEEIQSLISKLEVKKDEE